MKDVGGTPSHTILVVDDMPANLRLVVGLLQANGFLAVVAEDGEESVQRADYVRPDLILLDVKLPGIDGFEVCRRLKANPHTSDIPVIFMTVLDDEHDKVTGFAVGGVDYVTKPFHPAELIARVRAHLALRTTQQLTEQNQRLQREIRKREEAESRLQFQATHDALTGLPNRHLLLDRLEQAIASAQRDGQCFVVCLIDLDRFKRINDGFGHAAGDKLLKILAGRLSACLRKSDTAARLAGDEFVLLLRYQGTIPQAQSTIQRVAAAIAQPVRLGAHREITVTCSLGCSAFPSDATRADDLLRFADCAMYRAKEVGRDNLQLYNADLRCSLEERLWLEGELQRAVAEEAFTLHYQPQVDINSGKICGMEALLRWYIPERGYIAPSRFIPVAEEVGLIGVIGEWALRQACLQNKAWQQAGLPRMRVAVNLSGHQLTRGDIETVVERTLTETGLDPAWLELELTEGISMGDPEHVINVMTRLKAMGVSLAIDDFGTGYSNLQYLKRFPVDRLKLDGSFVREMTDCPRTLAIVDAIIAMSHRLDLKVVAEMVETAEQVRLLADHECDQAQGYYFSAALPAEQFTVLLQAGSVLV
ncbi:EAL domain-containing protein [Halomonas campisalis]|uniref:EAL domain-containing protein n=1 Tax=Billgrantia campisalis TaxID=74661 RepID=A0ABS9P756_9GAMM|nr:GGDEF domain-containing response regulator [Halomonas campisalis]MCG6657416.1 EAL domain-containing protein [Halomonas campisalis]MDR5863239.1 EAL domain-containing protein [Halomonas campisalis]